MNLRLFHKKRNMLKILTLTILTLALGMFIYYLNSNKPIDLFNRNGNTFEKAKVTEILQDNLMEDGSRVGNQKISVLILSGDLKGKTFEAISSPGYLYGANCKVNMKVIVSISTSNDTNSISVYNYYRSPVIYVFTIIFLGLLCFIGGKNGFKSAISLILTFFLIIFLFIPMIYKGYSPFFSSIIVVILTTVITMYLIAGKSKKAISASMGTITGVIISGIIAYLFGYFGNISGYNLADIEELIYISNYSNIQIGELLFSGILISALGAVMDVNMSIASTITEIHYKNPSLSIKELFKSGINVGRDMMGTMSNTLILAFTGGSITTLIILYSYNTPYNQMINMYSIGIEIMQGLSGSIAVILSVPIVSLITTLMYRKNSKF